jgi:hypothetical protein
MWLWGNLKLNSWLDLGILLADEKGSYSRVGGCWTRAPECSVIWSSGDAYTGEQPASSSLRGLLLISPSVTGDSMRTAVPDGQLFLRTGWVQGVLEIVGVCRILLTLFRCLRALSGLEMMAPASLLAAEMVAPPFPPSSLPPFSLLLSFSFSLPGFVWS